MGGLEAVTLFRQYEEGVLPKEIPIENKGEIRTSLTPATDEAYLTPRGPGEGTGAGAGKDQSTTTTTTNNYNNKNIKVPVAVVTIAPTVNTRSKRQFIIGMSANGEVRPHIFSVFIYYVIQ